MHSSKETFKAGNYQPCLDKIHSTLVPRAKWKESKLHKNCKNRNGASREGHQGDDCRTPSMNQEHLDTKILVTWNCLAVGHPFNK